MNKKGYCFFCEKELNEELYFCDDEEIYLCSNCNKRFLPCEKKSTSQNHEHFHRKCYFSGEELNFVDRNKILQNFTKK